MKMKVAIVIPNWNGADLINSCISSLLAQSFKAKIVVVDNGSVDKSVATIESDFPEIKLIKLSMNNGFSGGVNAGIRYALSVGFDAVAVFNNDATADKKWLEELVKSLRRNEQAGIVSSKQLRTDGQHIDSTGDLYSIWGMPSPRGRNQLDTGQYDTPEQVFSAPAAATLYRSKMLDEVGLFDERFFAYLEDVDISFRTRLAGWQIVYEPRAIIYHQVSATGSKLGSFSRYHYIKNFFMTYTKNMPGYTFWKYLPLFLLQGARLGVSSILRRGGLAYFRGLGRFTLNIPHVLRERRRIQRARRASPSSIDALLYRKRPPKIPVL